MVRRRQFLAGSVGVGTASLFGVELTGCGEKGPSNEWKVGAFFSLTGGDAQFGIDSQQGIEIAVEQINAGGGIKGKPMKVLFEDDKSLPSEVTNKVNQLIERDKVVAILGEVASSRSEPGGIVATKKQIPMISPSSTNAKVTKIVDEKTGLGWVFRVCFVDEFQGRVGAEFCVKTLGKKKIGIMYAENDAYSNGLAEEFKKVAKELGAEIVKESKFTDAETNFTTFINEMKDAGPDVIYAPVYYKQMVQINRQAKAVGFSPEIFVGGDGWSGDDTLLKEMTGAHFTDHHAPDIPWDVSKKFVEVYEGKHKKKPSSLAAMGYDAAMVLADAIKRAKEDTPKGIRDAIAETKDFRGVSGVITIDADRNAQKPIVIVQVKDGTTSYKAVHGPGADTLLGGGAPKPTASAAPTAEASAAPSASASASAATSASAAPSAAPSASAAPK
jgi:branched-chain amino acid transport system substrate-binding protein